MAWFHRAKPGDKVVCVSLPTKSNIGRFANLSVGKVYTITDIFFDPWFTCGVGISIGLLDDEQGGYEWQIGANNFRPIQPKSTEASMAALRAHLNTKEVVVDA